MGSRVLVVSGTRPEVIKLAPVLGAMGEDPRLEPLLCVTAQHRELSDRMLDLFGLAPAFDLDLMRPGQTPASFLAAAVPALATVIDAAEPQAIVVQGDTVTAFAAMLAGFYASVPVAHVESGLRAGATGAPFPEEGQRRMMGQIAAWHFAPTEGARTALVSEGVDHTRVHVTGNSGIDALLAVSRRLDAHPRLAAAIAERFGFLDPALPTLLATAHRRENSGERLEGICRGLALVAAQERAQIVMPVHPNPAVREHVHARLGGLERVHLVEPLDYLDFVWLLRRCALVLTDSGGIQEEAPTLGRPVLVVRDGTERPEGVAAGVAMLVGTSPTAIAGAARAVLRDPVTQGWMSRRLNLYGDGRAAERIVAVLGEALQPATEPVGLPEPAAALAA